MKNRLRKNTAQTIKNFIYLYEYKMYSISLQMSGGKTEYLIKYEQATKAESEEQIPSSNE